MNHICVSGGNKRWCNKLKIITFERRKTRENVRGKIPNGFFHSTKIKVLFKVTIVMLKSIYK